MIKIDKNDSLFLKGIAILGVLLCHFGLNLGIRYFGPFGSIGVAIFLFLSGYGINESYRRNSTLEEFWEKRFLNIYPSYFIVQILSFLIFKMSVISYSELGLDLLFLKSFHPYVWYIYEVFICYFVYYILRYWICNDKRFYILFSICFLFHFWTLDSLYSGQSLSFLLGVVYSDLKEEIRFYINPIYLFIIGVIMISLRQLSYVRMLGVHWQDLTMLVVNVSFSLFIVFAFLKYKECIVGLRDNVARIGAISYEVYLVHGYILKYFFCHSLMKMVIVFLVSWLVYRIQYRLKDFVRGNKFL